MIYSSTADFGFKLIFLLRGAMELNKLKKLKEIEKSMDTEEDMLDFKLHLAKNLLREQTEKLEVSQDAFVYVDEVRALKAYAPAKFLFIKAPSGARLEVPHPDAVCFHSYLLRFIFILCSLLYLSPPSVSPPYHLIPLSLRR